VKKPNKGYKLEWLNQLKELSKDNKEMAGLISTGMEEIKNLQSSNSSLAEKYEASQKRFNEVVTQRDTLKAEYNDAKTKLDGIELSGDAEKYQAEIQKLNNEYTQKLEQLEGRNNELQSKFIGTLKQNQLSSLNLASKLPKDMSEEQVKGALDFMHFQLEQEGLTYDEQSNGFIFKNEGVARINSETGNPFTLKEMTDAKIKSGAWDRLIQTQEIPQGGVNRGQANSGGGNDRKTINRDQFDSMNDAQRMEFATSGGRVQD